MKLIVRWLLLASSLLLVAYLYPGVTVTSFGSAMIAALVIGVFNTLLRPLLVLLTRLVAELGLSRPARVLSCMGLRAAESPARSKLVPFAPDERATGGGRRRVVDRWLPIFAWREDEVWARIHAAGLPIHDAYVVHGMPRLSCALCVFASRAALVKAARANPDLAARYAALEARTGHRFRKDLAIAAVVAEAEAGGEVGPIEGWAA